MGPHVRALAQMAKWESAVVTVPALALLMGLRQRPKRDTQAALVVGNPTDDLSHAEEEAREVAKMLGVEPLIGEKATKEVVLSRFEQSGLAHFATHAYTIDLAVCACG